MADNDKPKKSRVIASSPNPFVTDDGHRHDYSGLIMSALTGMQTDELREKIEKSLPASEREAYRKEIADGGDVYSSLLDAEDQFFHEYLAPNHVVRLIAPPIAPERLIRLVSENPDLGPCISAMVSNVAGTGYDVVPRDGSESELDDASRALQESIEGFLSEVYVNTSFSTMRRALTRDKYETGNAYMVVVRNALGDVAFLRRAPAKSVRMIRLDEPVSTEITVHRNGETVTFNTKRAERRFVQIVGTKKVYYKEYGASRDLDRETGKWAPQGTKLPLEKRAEEIIHFKDLEDVSTPYGLPRWICQLPSILGSRMAEENNLVYFHSGGMPPAIIFISGGVVSQETEQAINKYLQGTSASKQRGIAIEVPASGNLENERPATIKVEKFGAQGADSTFEKYLENNSGRIRATFRLPGIYLGLSDNYNFATALAAISVAEAQVFQPERMEDDELYNMTVMRELDPSGMFKISSRPMVIKDAETQLKTLSMLANTPGVSLSDWVREVSRVGHMDIQVAGDFEDAVIGVDVLAGGAMFPSDGAAQQDTASTDTGASTGSDTTNTDNLDEANILAMRITRVLNDYLDGDAHETLNEFEPLMERYKHMSEEVQKAVDQAVAGSALYVPIIEESTAAAIGGGLLNAIHSELRNRADQ